MVCFSLIQCFFIVIKQWSIFFEMYMITGQLGPAIIILLLRISSSER